jgi:antitoxin component YwqK of YwqJK toxin-antitoxin module
MKIIRLLCIAFVFLVFVVRGYSQQSIQENGYNKMYYPNGKISSEGYMRNGKPDGYWKTYYPSGVMKSEGNRTNFLLDSVWVFYNESGDTTEKVSYVLGKRNGYTVTFNTSEVKDPMQRGHILSRELYVNDNKEGWSYSYYPDGKVKEESLYTNNKRNGVTNEYDPNGVLITVMTYKNGFLTDREKLNRKDDKGLKQGIWRTYYENGKIKSEAYYVNDLLSGQYKEFDENGNIKVKLQYAKGAILEEKDTTALEVQIQNKYDVKGNLVYSGTYRDSVPVGIHRMYDSTGKVVNGYLFDNNGIKLGEGIITNEGKKEGKWKYFYSDGSVQSSGLYSNNQPSGKWDYFYKNGKKEQTGVFKQGKTDGLWQWYYPDGTIKREEEYYEGKSEGMYTEYDTTGQIIVSGKYFDGQKEDEWFYKVGDYSEKGKYVADLKDGKWQAFYADGTLKYEGTYVQGNPDGEHDFYYPSGKLKETNYYVMGISEKNWRKFDENGNLVLTITYKDNREYRINGEKVDFADNDIKLIQ